jgi:hypothetical protein
LELTIRPNGEICEILCTHLHCQNDSIMSTEQFLILGSCLVILLQNKLSYFNLNVIFRIHKIIADSAKNISYEY